MRWHPSRCRWLCFLSNSWSLCVRRLAKSGHTGCSRGAAARRARRPGSSVEVTRRAHRRSHWCARPNLRRVRGNARRSMFSCSSSIRIVHGSASHVCVGCRSHTMGTTGRANTNTYDFSIFFDTKLSDLEPPDRARCSMHNLALTNDTTHVHTPCHTNVRGGNSSAHA